jgi:hypothetical protein
MHLTLALALLCMRDGIADTAPPPPTVSHTVHTAPAQDLTSPAGGTAVLPPLQPGMWEFHRTLVATQRGRPQTATVKKCSDPRADYELKMRELRAKGCQFSPVRQTGGRFESTWRCPVSGGSVLMRDVVTVRSATSYLDETEARAADRVTHTVITANRRGDCTPMAVAPSSAPHKP